MRHGRIGRRGIETRLVRFAAVHGLLHGVVDFEDDPLGAVLAVRGHVLALDDGEGLHDVVHVVTRDAVEVEIGRVQLAAKEKATLLVPAEGRAVIAAVVCEGLQVPCGVRELKDAGKEPGVIRDP